MEQEAVEEAEEDEEDNSRGEVEPSQQWAERHFHHSWQKRREAVVSRGQQHDTDLEELKGQRQESRGLVVFNYRW